MNQGCHCQVSDLLVTYLLVFEIGKKSSIEMENIDEPKHESVPVIEPYQTTD